MQSSRMAITVMRMVLMATDKKKLGLRVRLVNIEVPVVPFSSFLKFWPDRFAFSAPFLAPDLSWSFIFAI